MIRVYLDADRALVRVLDLDHPEFLPEHLPEPAAGETTDDHARAMPDFQHERWDPSANAGAGDFMPIPPPERRLTQRGWMMRFEPAERTVYRLVLKGLSPSATYTADDAPSPDKIGEPKPLGARAQAQAEDLYELLHADAMIRPESTTARDGLLLLSALGVIGGDRVDAINVPVTDDELAVGWGA